MRRRLAHFLVALFLVGGLILPAIHKDTCGEHHAAHDAAHCAICQMASAPMQVDVPTTAPVYHSEVLALTPLTPPPVLCAVVSDTAQARAPPVA